MNDLMDLMDFARAYARLGWAVQEQLHDLIEDPDTEDLNPNAVRRMLELPHGEIQELAQDWLKHNDADDDEEE